MKINIIMTVIAFFVMLIFMYVWNLIKLSNIKKNKKKKGKEYDIVEFRYLALTYNINKEKLYNKKMIIIISIINAFIIALVFFIVVLIPWHIIWQLLVGLVLLLGLIYGIYGILGKILVWKGYDK